MRNGGLILMAIRFDKKNKTLTLQTNKSTYQMKIDSYGVLLHTYFGKKTDDSDYSYLIMPANRGFSGNPSIVGDTRTYSLDCYPQEYPTEGTGDYRINCLRVTGTEGASACELYYISHSIIEGKYNLEGLPTLFADQENKQVSTLKVVLKDRAMDFTVTLYYGVFEETGVITRAAVLENHTGKPLVLNRMMSGSVDLSNQEYEMIHFHGRHAMERQFERTPLFHGISEVRSTRGTSSHHQNPFFILCDKNTTEDTGDAYGFSLLYSGGFRGMAEMDCLNQTRVVMGIEDENFGYILEDGECFITPELCIAYSENGLTDLSHQFHNAYRQHLIRSKYKDQKRPVLINNWEATYFDFDGEKLLNIAKQAAELGLDLMVLDDGWFGKRDDDNSGLGDWFVNEKKLGCSLRELVDQVNGMGLMFGIWFEPEMINEDSELYRQHPDWALQIPKRSPIHSRNQLVLDFSRKDIREYIENQIFAIMDSANIEYIKWDMNRSIDHVFSAKLPPEKQGEIRHQYVLGLYEMMEHLLERYPNLLLEGCSGGGGRFDAGMLYYAPQIWCSDNTDAMDRLLIQYGTSFGYPMSSVSAHVSVCPNHQNGRSTPLKTRGICAYQGSFGYELDISKMSEEEKEMVKEQVKEYNNLYELILNGDYYRITSPVENRNYTVWEYVAKDKSKAMMSVVFTDVHGNGLPIWMKWKGLDKEAVYQINGQSYTGLALMNGGFLGEQPKEVYDSYCYIAVKL